MPIVDDTTMTSPWHCSYYYCYVDTVVVLGNGDAPVDVLRLRSVGCGCVAASSAAMYHWWTRSMWNLHTTTTATSATDMAVGCVGGGARAREGAVVVGDGGGGCDDGRGMGRRRERVCTWVGRAGRVWVRMVRVRTRGGC